MYTVQAFIIPGEELFFATNATKGGPSVVSRGKTVDECKTSYLRVQDAWFKAVAEEKGGLEHISEVLKGTPPRNVPDLERFVSKWERKRVTLTPQGETVLNRSQHSYIPEDVKVEFYLANYRN